MISRAAVEYPVVDHCNLRCYQCDHASPHLATRAIELETFERDVAAVAPVLRVKDLNIVGGEALMHPRLVELLDIAQASGIGQRVTLVTNGLLLHKASDAVFERIDRLRITTYPDVALKVRHEDLERRAREQRFLLDIRSPDEFLQPFPPRRLRDPKLVQRIYARCKTAHVWSCHALYRGFYYKCSRAPIISMTRNGTDDDAQRPPLGADGIALAGADLERRLRVYLDDRTPLAGCDWCLGTSGRMQRHRQLTVGESVAEVPHLDDDDLGLARPLDRVPGWLRRIKRIGRPPLDAHPG